MAVYGSVHPRPRLTKSTEVLACLSCDSRAQVDTLVAQVVSAGRTAPREAQDHGSMYGHGFEDLDGHIWELMLMEPSSGGES